MSPSLPSKVNMYAADTGPVARVTQHEAKYHEDPLLGDVEASDAWRSLTESCKVRCCM